jgi:Fur family ferric uptake transcriptional regulator
MTKAKIGQRKTTQREAISEVIRDAEGPLTVEEICERASRLVTSLGLATVYRTVKLLLESEEIRIVSIPHSGDRYEVFDLGHHHHFRCRACNLVFDLPGCLLPIPDGTSLPGGFKVEDHEVTLIGTCPDCDGAPK